ncbi:MAG: hypothetical protein NTV73_11640 [Hyphomicrobiales bacterium]|nr:hypothetical protein [Hyphomicrobiales bacterium]
MSAAWLAGILAIALCLHLYRQTLRSRAAAAQSKASIAKSVDASIANARDVSTGTAGVTTFAGTRNGERVQVCTIVDTLATRKLPAFWLSVSVTEKVEIAAVFDLMMRPGSATTFSNFDLLPVSLVTPSGYPEGAVIRTDRAGVALPLDTVTRHLDLFRDDRAKELLITANGVRVVWLVAEADRVRYGVLRQASFAGAKLDPELIEGLLSEASALRASINKHAMRAAA